MKPYLSVIVPAYNEEDNLHRGCLTAVMDYLSSRKFTWEMILVNDGSTDSTVSYLREFASHHQSVKVLDNPHMGKAATVISGALAAAGEVILFTDLDQSTPITEFDKFMSYFRKNYDIVIGSRPGRLGAPVFRQILAYGNVLLRSVILGLPFKDTQCGFKAFTGRTARRIFTTMNKVHPPVPITGPAVDPGFDVEMLYLGRKFDYKIAEVPVDWQYQESRRVSFLKDAKAGLVGLLLVRYRSLINSYKI